MTQHQNIKMKRPEQADFGYSQILRCLLGRMDLMKHLCAGGGGAGLSTNWLKDNLVSIFFPQMRLNLFS